MALLSDQLARFLDALENPLRYVARENFRAAQSASLPTRTWLDTLARIQEKTASLEKLEKVLATMESLSSEERRRAASLALAIMDEIRMPEKERAGTLSYQRTAGSVCQGLKGLQTPIKFVKEVGPRRGEELRKFGVETVGDLLYHLPFRYEDRRRLKKISELSPGADETTVGTLVHLGEKSIRTRKRKILEGVVQDQTGLLEVVWFHYSQYYKNRFKPGDKVILHGKVDCSWNGGIRITHPDIEVIEDESTELGQIVPVYSKPGSFHLKVFRRIVQRALDEYGAHLPSVLPDIVVARQGLIDLSQAMEQAHRPAATADVAVLNQARSLAHRSIVFDELFYLELGMALRRQRTTAEAGIAIAPKQELAQRLIRGIPFSLTAAQQRAIGEIVEEMGKAFPMNRLLQGDVGSGKTVVALACALVAIEDGYQVAFMAPTELLAEQHYEQIRRHLDPLGVRGAVLTGETPSTLRSSILNGLKDGEIQLVVGTHALIQEGVAFHRLGLCVIDEQHRFGVLQRGALKQRGENPNVLLMSATPIPRTLALTLYGDLTVSFLDEMPPGRTPVATRLFYERQRATAFALAREEIKKGHQAYIVYPLVSETEKSALRDATKMTDELAKGELKDFRIGLIHGQMKSIEKDQVMRRFRAGEIQVLVSTTVIEVGIDVPNATLIVVEHAERFGLSQLHQLRGRVGRGNLPSLCLLVGECSPASDAGKRLRVMEGTTDGFRIAEADLQIRGPGDFLGTRQHGLPDFRVANLVRDTLVLEQARREAQEWLRADPQLKSEPSIQLLRVLESRWAGKLELGEIG